MWRLGRARRVDTPRQTVCRPAKELRPLTPLLLGPPHPKSAGLMALTKSPPKWQAKTWTPRQQNRQTSKQTTTQTTNRQIDKQTGQTDCQTNRQNGGQGKQAGRQAGSQAGR